MCKIFKIKLKFYNLIILFIIALVMLSGCGSSSGNNTDKTSSSGQTYIDYKPNAPGDKVYEESDVVIDASNTKDGYVMVKYSGNKKDKIKILITSPNDVTYNYNAKNKGEYEAFVLSEGSGKYNIGVYKNITGTEYSTLYTKEIKVSIEDELRPFLISSQYVNFDENDKAVKIAKEKTKGSKDELEKVSKIYNYVIKNISYDNVEASSVESGYLPNINEVVKTKKGICFDYAALMTAMLRSVDVPTKLVIGYSGDAYHSWVNVYTKESGWVDKVIQFDGKKWTLMDPTFASALGSAKKTADYIGDGSKYKVKYIY